MIYPQLRLRSVVVTVALVLLIFSAASITQGKDNWTSVRSSNFHLIGNGSEKEIRQVATRLEQFRDVFTRLFPSANFKTPVPTTVIVFKSMSSYKPFNIGGNAGYFQKGEDVNYITMTTELGQQNPYSVIYHEYVHLLIDSTKGDVPAWFNEGLAEYYSTFEIEEDRKVHLGELIGYHLLTLRSEKLLPLRTLFEVDHYSPYYNESSKRGSFYAQSWALIHYLLLGNEGKYVPQLGRFLQLIGSNVATDEAFKQAFQMDTVAMEKELKKYIEGHKFRMQIATFERKLEFDSELKVAPLTEAEAEGYLGDLLLHTHRLDDAEKRLQRALTLDPKLSLAHSSLGILRSRQGRFAEARKSLEEAVNGDTGNYLAHYYYAFALSREGMDQNDTVRAYPKETADKMRAELKRAIELNPEFPGSYSLSAFVSLVTGDGLEESAAQLQRAIAAAPGRQDLSLMLAQTYLHQQKMDLARQVVQPLLESKDRQIKRDAASVLESIKSYEEYTNKYKSAVPDGAGDPPRLQRGVSPTTTGEPPPPGEKDPGMLTKEDYLRESLRPPEAGEERFQGVFKKLECDSSSGQMYFIVESGGRSYKLRALSFGKIEMRAYVPNPANISCGPRKTPEDVIVTFRPTNNPKDAKSKIDGDVIAVEMVPSGFQLKKP